MDVSSPIINSLFTLIAYFREQDGWDATMLWGHRIDDQFGVLGSLC